MGAIVVDSSALLSILFFEADAQSYIDSMSAADAVLISASTYTETGIVFDTRPSKQHLPQELDELIRTLSIKIIAYDADQALLAREAYRRYGKGNHKAGLNMGDCFAYALAKSQNLPLLFKGTDFSQTDVDVA